MTVIAKLGNCCFFTWSNNFRRRCVLAAASLAPGSLSPAGPCTSPSSGRICSPARGSHRAWGFLGRRCFARVVDSQRPQWGRHLPCPQPHRSSREAGPRAAGRSPGPRVLAGPVELRHELCEDQPSRSPSLAACPRRDGHGTCRAGSVFRGPGGWTRFPVFDLVFCLSGLFPSEISGAAV